MDECIIENWNSKIHKSDIVYVVGDFAFANSAYDYARYKTVLNGQIVLIRGNHDNSKLLKKLDGVFSDVKDIYNLKHNGHQITLCHYPMYNWDRSHFNTCHAHGHSHGSLVDTYDTTGKILDVGVDTNNFFPYHVEDVIEIMRKKPDNINYLEKEAGRERK